MGPTGICCIASVLLIASAADEKHESPPALTCDVAKQPNGLINYELSRLPSSPSCRPNWETVNKTVIVSEAFTFDQQLVQNVTKQSVFLKECHGYLHYRENCEGVFKEAHCRVNCSRLLDSGVHPTTLNSTSGNSTSVNSTLACFFGSWCPEQWLTIFLAVLAVIVILIASVFVVPYLCKLFKCIRRKSAATTASCTPANEQIKVELVTLV
ncbi:uncharacterized protein LOC119900207 [Micropterus salmoides]|uniref:uncharacterized protein LOC119900207 n=1 Tax=Micropterus salmoides TaxID=27706 RepID=UPI0018EA6482|nr:uncharacterized protein LOC119900207 [Micropterus salmoides]